MRVTSRSAALTALLATAATTYVLPALAGGSGGAGGSGTNEQADGGPPVVESMTPDPSACAVSSAPGGVALSMSGIAAALVVGASLTLRRRR